MGYKRKEYENMVLSRKLNEALFVRLFCVKTDTKLNVTEL